MEAITILIADDEETIRTYIREILEPEGYLLVEAADGLEAMEQIKRLGGGIGLVLADVQMPRMDGVALGNAISESYPAIPVLYVSGYPLDFDTENSARPLRPCAFLAKPFSPKLLLERVRECLLQDL
jgi:CheY-like chemotaxis protein